MDHISIRGARQHNLKNINLDIPRHKLVVITGVSGSGKSSLAFDTLFAEGERRYMESLSAYARQFLQRLDAPDVDSIEGLSPAVAIEQKGLPRNPRSTVGTLTEIHEYLRVLFARLGTVFCPHCDRPVRAYTIPQMLQELFYWPEGSRLLILGPLGSFNKKDLPGVLGRLRRDGYMRVRLNGQVIQLDPLPPIPQRSSYRVDVVVDRIALSQDRTRRLADSLELASKIGKGAVQVLRVEGGEKSFSELFRCDECGRLMSEPTPSLFSFHHPAGACSACSGLGYGELPVVESKVSTTEDEEPSGRSDWAICPECQGTRLNEHARSVRLGGLGIHEVSSLPLPNVQEWISGLDLTRTQAEVASRPREDILHRLRALDELGLSYLALSRSAHTLSGGEAQRIRLASQISSPLSGVLYVLDEPSMGLHPRDHARLLKVLKRLKDAGNSVIVVEHDAQTILSADYVIDIGPGAGTQGGHVIFAGTSKDLLQAPASLTGMYLSGRKTIAISQKCEPFAHGMLRISGASGNNLKSIDVDFPLGCMSCVTGVSGSGKSTLVLDTLYRALAQRLYHSSALPLPFEHIEGIESIRKVIHVDQLPIGRSPRSNPATYTGIFALIRHVFSELPESRARGYGPNRFSFNVKGGRCELCKGEGLQRIDMVFLPDVYVTCSACNGSRYNPETLEICFKGKSIAEVLDLTVHQALPFFESFPLIRRKLETLQEVGLGYIQLGQAGTTLSGGEAQRIKLSRELSRKSTLETLFIFDEPTTGLHFEDIEKLLHVLRRLVALGHTVILIEHHPDVIKSADYVVDLGPEGGEAGGYLVAWGTPEDVARSERSFTGRYLKRESGGARTNTAQAHSD